MKPVYDKVFMEWVHPVPIKCAVCNKCLMIALGKRAGMCVNMGPYKGYVEVEDAPPWRAA